MKRFLSISLAIVLLLGLGSLAVLARPGGASEPAAPAAAAQVESNQQTAAQPAAAVSAAPAAPAAGPKYNALALPLDNGITLASALVNDINATTGAVALQALKWDPNGGYTIYDPTDPFSVDFSLTVGDPVFMLMQGTGTTAYSMVGDVPAQGSVDFDLVGASPTCKYNFISVPLDQGDLTLASLLAADIVSASQVLMWDPNTGFTIYDPTDPFSVDFSVQIGYPYFVCMTANKTWPTP